MAKNKSAKAEGSTETYISGEEYQVHHGAKPTGPPQTVNTRTILMVAVVVVLCLASFLAGEHVQSHHDQSLGNTSTASVKGGFGSRFGGQRRGGFGQVTAISPNNITIQDQRTGKSMTYSITSSTTISDNGQTVDTSDIKTGDTVVVITDNSGSTTASRILVNPDFGGGAGQSSQAEPTQSPPATMSD